jgi:DhnA family fructose-bisphosphate aldolase class Ia
MPRLLISKHGDERACCVVAFTTAGADVKQQDAVEACNAEVDVIINGGHKEEKSGTSLAGMEVNAQSGAGAGRGVKRKHCESSEYHSDCPKADCLQICL